MIEGFSALVAKYGTTIAAVLGALVYSILRPARSLWLTIGGFVAGVCAAIYGTDLVVSYFKIADLATIKAMAFGLGVLGKELLEALLSREVRAAIRQRLAGTIGGK